MNILLWDFDGTLASRDGGWCGALATVVNRLLPERSVTKDDIRPFLMTGFPWHTPEHPHPQQTGDALWAALHPIFVRAYVGIGLEPALAVECAARVRSVYLEAQAWRVFADVVPCLTSLQRLGWRHYILSNHVPELPDLVRALGLSPYIVAVRSSGLTGFEKPHPEAYHGLLRQFPGDSTVWMVGDSLTADVRGAEQLGLPAILVRKPQPGARYYCESLTDIEGILSTQPALRVAE